MQIRRMNIFESSFVESSLGKGKVIPCLDEKVDTDDYETRNLLFEDHSDEHVYQRSSISALGGVKGKKDVQDRRDPGKMNFVNGNVSEQWKINTSQEESGKSDLKSYQVKTFKDCVGLKGPIDDNVNITEASKTIKYFLRESGVDFKSNEIGFKFVCFWYCTTGMYCNFVFELLERVRDNQLVLHGYTLRNNGMYFHELHQEVLDFINNVDVDFWEEEGDSSSVSSSDDNDDEMFRNLMNQQFLRICEC